MPSTRDPAALTPEDRARELARLLATGLVRLGSALTAPSASESAADGEPSDSDTNGLAAGLEKSVTGTGS